MTHISLLLLLHDTVYSGHCKDIGVKKIKCIKIEEKKIKLSLFVISMFHRASITKNSQQKKLLVVQCKNVGGIKSSLKFPGEEWLFSDPGSGKQDKNLGGRN